MKHTTQSILLATLLLASGFASAQSPTAPATRADVKGQISKEGSAGDKRGEGPVANVPTGGSSESTRAGVKAETPRQATTGVDRGEGPVVSTPKGGSSENTRAGVKAEIPRQATTGVERGQGPVIDNKSTMTAAERKAKSDERKAKRDERNAKAKAKRDGAMKTGSTPPAPVSGIAR